MYLLRRAGLRGLQSVASQQSSRPFASSTSYIARRQTLWQPTWPQKRCYSESGDKNNASPAENESGETVTEEPSAGEQKDIVEESVATPEVADAAKSSEMGETPSPESVASSASTTIKGAMSSAARTMSEVASSVTGSTGNDRGFEYRGDRGDRGDRGGHRRGATPGEPSKILYVGNLFFDLTPDRLEGEFAKYGNVVNCKIVTDSSGLSKGFGYVEYEDLDSAAEAIRNLNLAELEGRRMAVQYHVRKMRADTHTSKPRNPPSRTLFVGNMSFQMTDKDLNDLFRSVKNVLDVRVAIDRRSGQPRGFAHADFTDTASAEKAKTLLEAKTVYGRQLRIDFGLPSKLSTPKDDEE